METRLGKIMVGKAGGTASSGSKTYKISLPSAWVTAMGFAGESCQVLLSFDGEGITIRPKQSMEQYRASRTAQGHILCVLLAVACAAYIGLTILFVDAVQNRPPILCKMVSTQ
mgnify:FL=1